MRGKLTDEQWKELFKKHDEGKKIAELAKEHGITRQAIYSKNRGRNGDTPTVEA